PSSARGVDLAQERIVRRGAERRQNRPALLERQRDDALRVDRFAFLDYRNVVEVEKIHCPDRLEVTVLDAGRAHVTRDARAEIALVEQHDAFAAEPPVE